MPMGKNNDVFECWMPMGKNNDVVECHIVKIFTNMTQ